MITLKISKRYQTGIQTFFELTTCSTESLESIGILVHYEFKFLSVSGTLCLEVNNTPGTSKVLGSKLI